MRDMHERRFRRPENGSHFDRALGEPDQFAQFLASRLDGFPRFKSLPAATRQNRALELDRRRAEPAATGQDAQPLFLIHLKAHFSYRLKLLLFVKYPKLGNVKTPFLIVFARHRADRGVERGK
jgi:hypothetical protein